MNHFSNFLFNFLLIQGAYKDQELIEVVGKNELGIGIVFKDQRKYY